MPQLPREHSRTALRRPFGFLFFLGAGLLFAQSEGQHKVVAVRFWTLPEVTRVAVEIDGQYEILSDHLSNPERVFFDLVGTHPMLGPKNIAVIPVGDKLIQQIRVAEPRKNVTRVVLDLEGMADISTSRLENPSRLIIEVRKTGHSPSPPRPAVNPTATAVAVLSDPVTPAAPTSPAPPAREIRLFHPPVKIASAPRRVQVALLDPPVVQVGPAPLASLNAKLITDYSSMTAALYRRAVDLKHMPDPSEPEIGPHAYPVPNASKQNIEVAKADTARTAALNAGTAKIEPPKVQVPELASNRVASSGLDTKLVASHDSDAVAVDTPAPAKRAVTSPADTALPAKRNATGDRSMIRVLGLKVGRIVLDAGHGGHDTGTVGPEGLREKDLVLDVTKRLGALIEDRMGSEVVYTRSDDTFIPLERRTEIANEAKADLFLSVHANSSPIRTAAGVETYYLSFTTSKTALDLAARENAASNETVYDLHDVLQKIALNDKVDESRDFAARVQTALFALSAKNNKAAKDRGVRKAPFVVLIGANMPSVLAEIGFISNAHDESTMKKAEYRERIAEALYKGVSGYASTLSHFQVAQRRSGASE
jgi:N-acetylmuramoyl-L-alanine amidase